MKKVISLFLSFVLVFAIFNTIGYAQGSVTSGKIDNLTWTLDGEGTLTIGGEGEIGVQESCPWIASPDSIKKLIISGKITSIYYDAFINCQNLKELVVGDEVEEIWEYEFNRIVTLESVYIGKNVKEINNNAFAYTNLKNITIDPDNQFYSFEDGALFDKEKTVLYKYLRTSKATEYSIPKGVRAIVSEAFSDCNNLKIINVPNGVEYIGNSAFFRCDSLTKIKLPDSVNYLGRKAFFSCEQLEEVRLSENMTCLEAYTFSFCYKLQNVKLPENLSLIMDHAFWYCASLSEITIPERVKSIPMYAFEGCHHLTKIYIPKISSVAPKSFTDCRRLKDVYYAGSVFDRMFIDEFGHSGISTFTNATWHYHSSGIDDNNKFVDSISRVFDSVIRINHSLFFFFIDTMNKII